MQDIFYRNAERIRRPQPKYIEIYISARSRVVKGTETNGFGIVIADETVSGSHKLHPHTLKIAIGTQEIGNGNQITKTISLGRDNAISIGQLQAIITALESLSRDQNVRIHSQNQDICEYLNALVNQDKPALEEKSKPFKASALLEKKLTKAIAGRTMDICDISKHFIDGYPDANFYSNIAKDLARIGQDMNKAETGLKRIMHPDYLYPNNTILIEYPKPVTTIIMVGAESANTKQIQSGMEVINLDDGGPSDYDPRDIDPFEKGPRF